LVENVRIPSYGGRGSKIAQTVRMIFERYPAGNGQLLSGCGFVQNIAPPPLSRDRRINMQQTSGKLEMLCFCRDFQLWVF